MSRNYQMHGLFQDEARRADNHAEWVENREQMAREAEAAQRSGIDAIGRPLSACELRQLEESDLD